MLSVFFLCSCQNKSTNWTLQEKATAKKEISEIAKGVIQSAEKLDIETAIKPYLNSPDFLMINIDGSADDYATFRSKNTEAFQELNYIKQTTVKEDFRLLSKKQIIYT